MCSECTVPWKPGSNWTALAIIFLGFSWQGVLLQASPHIGTPSACLYTWPLAANCLHPISALKACHRRLHTWPPSMFTSQTQNDPLPYTSFRPTCTVTSHSSFMLCLHCGGLVAADQLWSRQLVNFPGVYWVAIIPFPMGSKLHPRKGAPFGVCPSLSTFPLP